ncbi:AAA family ATPase [Chloroflexota bacterium]
MIKAEIKNCNNIISSTIQIRKNHLNIRYAMNGTGKSTIAQAIMMVSDNANLSVLQPFGSDETPSCVLSPNVGKVILFNEDYVDRYVFQQSDVIQNAFEVFIKSPDYEHKLESINARLDNLRIDISQNTDIQRIATIGGYVLSKLTSTPSGQLRRNPFFKSLTEAKKIFKLPPELVKFKPLTDKEYVVDWVDWKNQGTNYDDNHICPFCTTALHKDYETEKKIFTESYSKSNVKNLKEMLSYFDDVKDFMDVNSFLEMNRCVRETTNGPEIEAWLNRFWTDLKLLVTKIQNVLSFNSYEVRSQDISSLEEQLNSLLFNLSDLQIFNNQRVKDVVDLINGKIAHLLKETEQLKNELGQLNALVSSAKKNSISDVNDFLKTAGINYQFEIVEESENKSRALLKYLVRGKEPVLVEDIKPHLSWGERNAFALVLFMHDALRQQPDIIILDDPISSFDSHKKYAIINRLFSSKQNSLYKKTVLMLTHDLQPLIDLLVVTKPVHEYVCAHFLQNNDGVICEQEITQEDIRPLPTLLTEHSKDQSLNVIHRMACLRKLLDSTPKDNDRTVNAYHLLSSLFHLRQEPTLQDNVTKLTHDQIKQGEEFIRQYISDFRYSEYSKKILDKEYLLKSFDSETKPYIRLQIFRMLLLTFDIKSKISDDALVKYIDEQLHIENDYLFSLDFLKYDIVPDFVIPRCSNFLKKECKIT